MENKTINFIRKKFDNFLSELPFAQTFYGVQCLMDKNFVFLKENQISKLTYAVDMEEYYHVTLNRVHTCEGTRWNCYITYLNAKIDVWSLFKPNGGSYGKPVIPDWKLLEQQMNEIFDKQEEMANEG